MGISSFGTGAASFLASAVEFVEALTIVLALGVTRGWRSSLWGAATAIVLLAAAVAAIGPGSRSMYRGTGCSWSSASSC